MISGAAVGLAVTFVALYVYTAALRVTYPFDLEWEEGAFMDHVLRVVHGHPIYVRPSLPRARRTCSIAAPPVWATVGSIHRVPNGPSCSVSAIRAKPRSLKHLDIR